MARSLRDIIKNEKPKVLAAEQLENNTSYI